MAEGDTNPNQDMIEIIPGVPAHFSRTGLSMDVYNTWFGCGYAQIGMFDKLEPLQTYEQYLSDQDALHSKANQHGLYEATMAKSNPKAVLEFNKIINQYNADLERIKEEKDAESVEEYLKRAYELKEKLPEEDQ